MNKYFTREVKIGLTGIVALVILYFGIQFLKGMSLFSTQDTYCITFKNAKGLSRSSTVYADGYDVGIVKDIYYDFEKPGQVVVTISVDRDVRIPKGSSAELSEAMLGGCTLNLLLANNPRERYQPGDTLTGSDGSGLMESIGAVMPDVQQVLQRVDTLVATLNLLASNDNLPLILANAQQLSANLNESSARLNQLLARDVPQLTSNLNTTLTTANGTIETVGTHVVSLTDNLNGQVTTLTDNLNGKLNEVELRPLMDNLNGTVEHMNTLTTNLGGTVSQVNGVLGQLQRTDNTFGLLLNDTTLYSGLTSTMGSANNLLIDLKAHPKRYVHFSLFGRKDK